MTDLVPTQPTELIVPAGADKHARYRLGRFSDWLAAGGHRWHRPDLAAYRDHLLGRGLAPATVRAHLSTIRGRYRAIIKARDLFHVLAAAELERQGQEDTPANRGALVGELIARLENAIDPAESTVPTIEHQDRPDSAHVRLTADQANRLMAAPGVDTLPGLRDTAAIALMLCTGIREAELVGLDVPDLRQRLGGELALEVREGKGRKARLVPYGDLEWVLAIVDKWREAAGIRSGAVLSSFWRGGERLRGRLSVRAVQDIVGSYPVVIDGHLVAVRPHDLRRTYARRLYEAGVDLTAIQQNLGHKSQRTTLGYIGTLDAERRRAPAVYSFDLSRLARVPVQGRLG